MMKMTNEINLDINFTETPVFSKTNPLPNEECEKVIDLITANPECGVLIRGSGGLRKLRYKLGNHGKSGGLRIIYFWHKSQSQIVLLYAYKKSKQENLTPEQIKILRDYVKTLTTSKIS